MQRFYIVYCFYILGISEMKIVKILLLPFLFSAFEDFIIQFMTMSNQHTFSGH